MRRHLQSCQAGGEGDEDEDVAVPHGGPTHTDGPLPPMGGQAEPERQTDMETGTEKQNGNPYTVHPFCKTKKTLAAMHPYPRNVCIRSRLFLGTDKVRQCFYFYSVFEPI